MSELVETWQLKRMCPVQHKEVVKAMDGGGQVIFDPGGGVGVGMGL